MYAGELTTQGVVVNTAKIKMAFPALPAEFYKILTERIREKGFTDHRLRDSVLHVIDTCPYPIPTIANFISFDRAVKVYSYEEMLKKASDFGTEIWNSYKGLKFKNREKKVWVHVDDVKMYNLSDEG